MSNLLLEHLVSDWGHLPVTGQQISGSENINLINLVQSKKYFDKLVFLFNLNLVERSQLIYPPVKYENDL